MDTLVSVTISVLVLLLGLLIMLFPRVTLRVICRCARSYLKDDLSTDPYHIWSIRFYGLAAAGLGAYALYQVLG